MWLTDWQNGICNAVRGVKTAITIEGWHAGTTDNININVIMLSMEQNLLKKNNLRATRYLVKFIKCEIISPSKINQVKSNL